MYEQAKNCIFPNAKAPVYAMDIPRNLVEVDYSGAGIQLIYKHKKYAFGISPEGIGYGFRGKLRPDSVADLIILSFSGGDRRVYERRFTPAREVELICIAHEDKAAGLVGAFNPLQQTNGVAGL